MARFEINKQGIQRMSRALEREFAKYPVRVPLEVDPSGVTFQPAATVTNYHGPVVTVHGDNAQIAWDSDTVNQAQNRVEQIAPGYEDLARLVTDLLANLDTFALNDAEATDVRASADAVLSELVKEKPDQGVVRRGVTMIKGVLAPVVAGVDQAVKQETAEAARHVIEGLGNALPS